MKADEARGLFVDALHDLRHQGTEPATHKEIEQAMFDRIFYTHEYPGNFLIAGYKRARDARWLKKHDGAVYITAIQLRQEGLVEEIIERPSIGSISVNYQLAEPVPSEAS